MVFVLSALYLIIGGCFVVAWVNKKANNLRLNNYTFMQDLMVMFSLLLCWPLVAYICLMYGMSKGLLSLVGE